LAGFRLIERFGSIAAPFVVVLAVTQLGLTGAVGAIGLLLAAGTVGVWMGLKGIKMQWICAWVMFLRGLGAVCLVGGMALMGVGSAAMAQSRATVAAGKSIVMVLPRDEQDIELAFRDYLAKRKLGVKIETMRYSGKNADAQALIDRIRKARPDLLYIWGTPTSLALAGTYDTATPEKFIRDIPIVFTEVTDPVGSKLLKQLNPPQRNVTGVSHLAPLAVQVNAIKAYRPVQRLGYITNPKEPNTRLVLQALQNWRPP
jgi:putative ABC transport system substrate-binding protein